MNELKNIIASAIDDWKFKKLSNIEVDPETDYEIFKTTTKAINHICEELDELNEDIDYLVETMNEPSDYEAWKMEDDIRRTNELRRL